MEHTYKPEDLFAGAKPVTAVAVIGAGQTFKRATPLMLDETGKKLAKWNGSKQAVAISATEVEDTGSDQKKAIYAGGGFRKDSLHWPDGTDDAAKLAAFLGTQIQIADE